MLILSQILGDEGRTAFKTYGRFHVPVSGPRYGDKASPQQLVYKVSRAGRQEALREGSVRSQVPGSLLHAPPPEAHTDELFIPTGP